MKQKNTYIEGNQTINFPEDWQVIKIDKHPYYLLLSGYSLKSVDFIAIHPDWGLVLIELKDYPEGVEKPDNLSNILEKKFKDTLSLIHTVDIYLNKRWYYRLFYKLLKWHLVCPKEWDIWLKANIYIQQRRIIKIADIST